MMSRERGRIWRFGILLGLLGSVGSAEGQTPAQKSTLPEPQRGEPAARPLLVEPAVQREIKLTATQRERLAELDGEVEQARQGLADPAVGEVDFAALIGQARQVEQERAKAIGRILTSSQKARLTQLEWQREGWLALVRPEVAARLKLSIGQKEKLGALVEQLRRAESQAILGGGATLPRSGGQAAGKPPANLNPANGFIDPTGGEFADAGPFRFSNEGLAEQAERQSEAVARLWLEAALDVEKILDDGQRSAFLDLLGPRFDFRAVNRGGSPPAEVGPGRTEARPRTKSKK